MRHGECCPFGPFPWASLSLGCRWVAAEPLIGPPATAWGGAPQPGGANPAARAGPIVLVTASGQHPDDRIEVAAGLQPVAGGMLDEVGQGGQVGSG